MVFLLCKYFEVLDSIIEKGEEISYTYDVLNRLNLLNSISGMIDNFKNTFHLENMSKFTDKDTSYKEKVTYAKEANKTVATIYGGYKVGASVYDKITSPSSFGTMSKTDSLGYQNYWNQVKQGVSVEQRYNLQKFGTLDTVNTVGNLKMYNALRNVDVDSLSLTRSSGYDVSGVKKVWTLDMRNLTIKKDKYLEHIDGDTYKKGNSTLSISREEAQRLVNEYAGKGKVIRTNQERVNFGTVIGTYKSKDGMVVLDTTVGMIHYSKDGAHIVPARPKK